MDSEKIATEWVLSLDADYVLTSELISEIKSLQMQSEINSYSVKFKYCVFGKPLHGTLLPPRKILYNREKGVYQDDGHAHRVYVEGKIGNSFFLHSSRRSQTLK